MPVPEMNAVESSAVKAIGYDAEAEEAFESKGTFVNAVIKEYPFREV